MRSFVAHPPSGLQVPERSVDRVARHYDVRGAEVLPSDGPSPVVNMGYWAERGGVRPTTLHDACAALFDLVLDAAGVVAGDRVLDAGCGFGTAALRAAERGARVTGVNVSSVQLEHARRAADARGATARFLCVSATALPLADRSLDRVVSIEAAFHFGTRDAFFAEAHRVLRPGGTIAIADLVLTPPRNALEARAIDGLASHLAFPRENVYDLATYVDRVRASGLQPIAHRSIAADVVPSFRRWFLRNLWRHRGARRDLAQWPYLAYPWDYALIVARRPA